MVSIAPRLTQANALATTRANALARALASFLKVFGTLEMVAATRDPYAYARLRVKKEKDESLQYLKTELRRLLLMYGLREAADAASGAAGRRLIPESLIYDATLSKPVNIKWFWEMRQGIIQRVEDIAEQTREAARESVKRIILESRKEDAQPSVGEIARRIRTQFQAPTGTRGAEAERERTQRVHATEDGREFIFSSERAAIIARTELSQAQNAGTFNGYAETGVEELEWLAYKDGRSGNRHHEKMDGKRVKVGELFVLPSGVKLRYPGDFFAPIGETINCRCAISPAEGKSKSPKPSPQQTQETQQALDESSNTVDVSFPESVATTSQSLFRRHVKPEDIAALTGFKNSKVTVSEAAGDIILNAVLLDDAGDRIGNASRYITREPDGSLAMVHNIFQIDKQKQGQGVGAEVFSRAVDQASKMGINHIKTEAARGNNLNGYYTWARLGYDGDLPEDLQRETGLKRISELMETPEGRALWKERGRTFDGKFDLRPGSRSRRALDAYMREKKKK